MIIRTTRQRDFTTVDNEPFIQPYGEGDDDGLSAAARGVLMYLLTKPDGWETRLKDLLNQFGPDIGRDKMKAILRELQRKGYMDREQARPAGGKFGPTTTNVYNKRKSTVDASAVNGSTVSGKSVHIEKTDGEVNTDIHGSAVPTADQPESEGKLHRKVSKPPKSVNPMSGRGQGVSTPEKPSGEATEGLDAHGRDETEVKAIRIGLMDLYDRMLQQYEDRKIGNSGANAGAAIKKFLADGFRVKELPYAELCYHELKQQPFWRAKHLNLHHLHEGYWAWRTEYKKQHLARKGQQGVAAVPYDPDAPVEHDPAMVALYGDDYYAPLVNVPKPVLNDEPSSGT